MCVDPRDPVSDDQSCFRFSVLGIHIRLAFKKLKPAFPRRRKIGSPPITLSAAEEKLTFGLPGAAVSVPAQIEAPFRAEIPFSEFQMIATDPFDDADLILFELAPGSITVRGITTRSPEIRVEPGTIDRNVHSAEPPALADPMDAPIGLPLVAAYVYIRRHGLQQAIANRRFAQEQLKVDEILNKAGRLLQPLGLSRTDIERLLDQRFL